jgi:uncharacterized protein (UPF0303 family)
MGTAEDLTRIAEQERALRYPHWDAGVCWSLGTRLQALALERAAGRGVVVDIRRFGQQLFFAALDGATPDNAEWVRRKSNTVARFHRSSYAMGLELAEKGATVSEKYGVSEADYVTHGGSFPLAVTGAGVVGAITVSGLVQRADHELVVEALCAELGHSYGGLRLA